MDMPDQEPRRFRSGKHSATQQPAEVAGQQSHAVGRPRNQTRPLVGEVWNKRRDRLPGHAQSNKPCALRTDDGEGARGHVQEECVARTSRDFTRALHKSAIAGHVDTKEEA